MLLKWSVRPQVKAFSKRLSLELGTHYPCSRAVFTGSVYKGHEKAKRRAFFSHIVKELVISYGGSSVIRITAASIVVTSEFKLPHL